MSSVAVTVAPEDVSTNNSSRKVPATNTATLDCPSHVTSMVPQLTDEQTEKHRDHSSMYDEEASGGTTPVDNAPDNPAPQLQRWNSPQINTFRTLAAFWDFIILGAGDAVYGALIPYLETYYNLDYLTVSLIFLSPIVGCIASALTNNAIHTHYGQRGLALVVSVSHLVAFTAISLHPPYPVLIVIFMLAGYGTGLADSGFNAWVGDMANANEVLGFLHGFYGLGALLSPLLATTVITKAGWQWYEFYYLMIGASSIEVLVLVSTFWKATGAVYQAQHVSVHNEIALQDPETPVPEKDKEDFNDLSPRASWSKRLNPFRDEFFMNRPIHRPKEPEHQSSSRHGILQKIRHTTRIPSTTVEAVNNRVTILSALFLLFYVGAEVSIGGWVVTFMLRVRHGTKFASGIVATGFWLGVTVGRFVLGFVTGRLFPTEKHAVACYLVICIVLQLLFWLIPNFLVSAVMVALIGFFVAPLFPAAVVAMTKLLPKRLHVAGIGFAAATGATGATVLPFAVGAIASKKGVTVLQPIVLALLVIITLIWLLLPKLPKQRMA